ncbi:hypothetical protein HPP92_002188 [Vanilla planifolia]|uniref:Uncharacterized protein n=1 Tax=Vanilla planifolia TaxID=51239 RepID=A0A835S1A8_VANPL|nr:hypothetical protein HPP92_002491 [Vanilla planifolia]KAG0502116.1 hypothetical protein HPP92_002188 [Vanilla planifolia]
MTVLLQHPQNLILQGHEDFFKRRRTRVKDLRYSGLEFQSRGALCTQSWPANLLHGRVLPRLVSVRVVHDNAEESSSDDDSVGKEGSPHGENKELFGGLSREDLEKIVGHDDVFFSGVDLANLIRSKYGRSYDVQLIKKEFMGRNLLAVNIMWKYMEQRSFPLTEEEYILRLDDVANTLKCWGAVSYIRSSLAKLKDRPRIGKAVSIFIDMDENGGRANEWIYK